VSTPTLAQRPDDHAIEWRLLYDAPCSLYTHPRQLAARALMSGHTPVDLHTARILEVGSALGGNLTPIAASLPGAECIGVDPFVEQTEQATLRAQRAGVSNVTYLPIGVEELDQVDGSFDYIICHGLLSWIPPHAQHETLELCARRLSPQGVAYISYNTYPRWHQLMYVRDALRWRGRHLQAGEAFEEESRRSLAFFAEHASTAGPASTRAIFSQAHQSLQGKPDYYLAHEYLLEENHPFYFHEVMERVAQAGGEDGHGLCYLADLSLNVEQSYPQLKGSIQRELRLMGDSQLALQQNLDFVFNRSLRRSLFIRSDAPRGAGTRGCPQWAHPTRDCSFNTLTLEELSSLTFASPFTPVTPEGFNPLQAQRWRHRHTGLEHTLRDPLAQCLLLLASLSWPQPLSDGWSAQVWELYLSLTGAHPQGDEQSAQWSQAFSTLGFLELISPPMSEPPPLLRQPPTSEGALPQAAQHLTSPELPLDQLMNPSLAWREVSNLYHETTLASPALAALLPTLHGSLSRADAVEFIQTLSERVPQLFEGDAKCGASIAWPAGSLRGLSASERLNHLLQEAYELALLSEDTREI